jgi:hypothetical protein
MPTYKVVIADDPDPYYQGNDERKAYEEYNHLCRSSSDPNSWYYGTTGIKLLFNDLVIRELSLVPEEYNLAHTD